MADCAPIEFCRQQFEKAAEIGWIELFGRRELPEQWAKPIAEFGYPGIKKAFDRVTGLLSTHGGANVILPLKKNLVLRNSGTTESQNPKRTR
jgi:hypothetical protein